jgi:putative SOS response-associated peptidase YedK
VCGRAFQNTPPERLREKYGTTNALANQPPCYNIAPTMSVPVVRFNPTTRARTLDPLRWGLVPFWAKDLAIGTKAINARSEDLANKPMFREAYAQRRCLVPVDGFYEWRRVGTGKAATKQPYAIALAAGGVMTLAGLWERWKSPAGEVVRSFTIVTTTANDALQPLHDRMPVILDDADHAAWLGEQDGDPGALLRPCPNDRLRLWPVSSAVNNVRNDGASLIEPAPEMQATVPRGDLFGGTT